MNKNIHQISVNLSEIPFLKKKNQLNSTVEVDPSRYIQDQSVPTETDVKKNSQNGHQMQTEPTKFIKEIKKKKKTAIKFPATRRRLDPMNKKHKANKSDVVQRHRLQFKSDENENKTPME